MVFYFRINFADIKNVTLVKSILKFEGKSRNLELECKTRLEAEEWYRLILKYCKSEFVNMNF